MSASELKELVFNIAVDTSRRGPGWSQEAVVLREVGETISRRGEIDLKLQQMVLDAWHDLFSAKQLGWGYDLDNSHFPFFHVR